MVISLAFCAIGVLVAHDKIGPDPRFTSADLRLAEQFANRAAIAVDLSRQVARDALRLFRTRNPKINSRGKRRKEEP